MTGHRDFLEALSTRSARSLYESMVFAIEALEDIDEEAGGIVGELPTGHVGAECVAGALRHYVLRARRFLEYAAELLESPLPPPTSPKPVPVSPASSSGGAGAEPPPGSLREVLPPTCPCFQADCVSYRGWESVEPCGFGHRELVGEVCADFSARVKR